MIVGCAQRGDNHNPLGLTGGSDSGYGKRQGYYYSVISQDGNDVEGVWIESNNTLTIHEDGTFEFKSDEEIKIGTYTKEKDRLTLKFKDGPSITYIYKFEEGQLVLTVVE
jgi:hypothetical protein